MLVLSRKSGEAIKIGKDISVSILKIEGTVIRVGIEAPKHVSILRMEVFEKIESENRLSALRDIKEISDAAELIKQKFPGRK